MKRITRIKTAKTAKIHQPETLSQALEHQRLTGFYIKAGLCESCAAQAGYGHQLGFNNVRQPCPACRPLVDAFAIPKANGWRAQDTRPNRASTWHTAKPATDVPSDVTVHIDGVTGDVSEVLQPQGAK